MKNWKPILIAFSFFLLLSGGFFQSIYAQEEQKLSELSLEDLLNMDVSTASKSDEKQSDAPGILSVLSKDELDRFGGTTLRDILERVPGLISSGANYTNRTTIAPRGDQIKQNSSHVLFLINGRPVRETQEGGVSSEFIESFPVNIIEKVEVIKGPGSVLYGSDAFSAVVNVITQKAETTGFNITGLAQNGGGYKTTADVKLNLGDLQIVAAGNYFEKAQWETTLKGVSTIYLNEPPFVITQDVTTNASIPNRGAGSYLGVNYKGLSLMTSYNQWKTDYVSSATTGEINLDKLFTNLGYSFNVNDNWAMDLNATYTHSNLDGSGISIRSSYNLVAEWTNSITLSDVTKLVIGGLFNRNDGEETMASSAFFPAGTIVSQGTINSFAFYAQLDYRVVENLKLIGGVQANKVDNIDLNIVPRAGLIWYPADRFSVKALYSTAFRAPSINEVNMNFGTFLKGNPALKPENVSTVDVSFGYQGQQAQFGLNLFYSKMTDITQIVYDASFAGQYQNAANVTFMGGEFEAKYYVDRNLYLTGSVLYQTNENDKDVKNQAPIANFGAKAGISYVTDNGITLGLFNIYQGDLDDRYTQNLNPYQGSYNLLHFNSKFNLNKLFDWSFKPELTAIFNVDNVLDKPHFGYDLGGTSGDGIPSVPGRAIYFGLNLGI